MLVESANLKANTLQVKPALNAAETEDVSKFEVPPSKRRETLNLSTAIAHWGRKHQL
jgi:hypothetical protein